MHTHSKEKIREGEITKEGENKENNSQKRDTHRENRVNRENGSILREIEWQRKRWGKDKERKGKREREKRWKITFLVRLTKNVVVA